MGIERETERQSGLRTRCHATYCWLCWSPLRSYDAKHLTSEGEGTIRAAAPPRLCHSESAHTVTLQLKRRANSQSPPAENFGRSSLAQRNHPSFKVISVPFPVSRIARCIVIKSPLSCATDLLVCCPFTDQCYRAEI